MSNGNYCKICKLAYNRFYYHLHRQQILDRKMCYYQENVEIMHERNRRNYIKRKASIFGYPVVVKGVLYYPFEDVYS